MFEKVNPSHPDKVADRIAGAIVDLAYKKQENPKAAVEVLLGHGICVIIIESSVEYNYDDSVVVEEKFNYREFESIVARIAGDDISPMIRCVKQDAHLAKNQDGKIRCGDNGIFKGVPVTEEQKALTRIAKAIYEDCPYDGKYVLTEDKLIICQSNDDKVDYSKYEDMIPCGDVVINPLGYWTGGPNVDSGCTNRKLGSDMADSVTGGGLSGKDCSKADVSANIYAWLKAQKTGKTVELSCAIGDEEIDGVPYEEIVSIAKEYIDSIGGFEKFSEWGLVR